MQDFRGATMSPPRKRRRISPWWALLLVPVIGGGLAASGVIKAPSSTTSTDTASKLETAVASQGQFRVSVTGPGTLEAGQTLDVKAEVNGTVASLPKEGQRVTRGELVATLARESFNRNVENAQLALAKAQAQLESQRAGQANTRGSQNQQLAQAKASFDNATLEVVNAQTNLTNTKNLFAAGGSSSNDVTTAASNLQKAQSNLTSARIGLETAQNSVGIKANSDTQDLRNSQLAVEQAQISLKNAQSDANKTKIYAPVNGVISSVTAQTGSPVSGTLFTIIDDSVVELPVQVDETEIGKIKVGQPADVALDALPDGNFKGKVSRISPKATVVSNIAVFYVRVRLENPDRVLRPGMSAEAEIISQQIDNAVTVSKRAVETVRNRAYVQLLGKDGITQERTRVRTGPDDGTNIVITSGLERGQTVVLPTRGSNATTTTGGN
jgi:HlyD family secretion protein